MLFFFFFPSLSTATPVKQVNKSTWLMKRWAGWFLVWCAATHPTRKEFCLMTFRISYHFSYCHTNTQLTSHWFCSQNGSHSVHLLNMAYECINKHWFFSLSFSNYHSPHSYQFSHLSTSFSFCHDFVPWINMQGYCSVFPYLSLPSGRHISEPHVL